ncbi:MAG TPA: dTDP-4-dehydrorhamnose 3,5-epimerase [Jatrophihabitans sp.]|uniref:dTDP-4-dehydrorhamnose 3,5-epimerase family protein n=1 Tax=Jatrophihabitans sp. TaxID=1932789 RepID=UPI002DFB42E7|nr:dTDP-4-dehydrorhamnose 3,5-epimerase [Jatrophihabitans sp.]
MTVVPLRADATAIDGLLRITTKTVTDQRGTVREFFRTSGFREAGVDVPERWAQINLTFTQQGGLRGLHGEATDKLIGIASGEAFGAWVDARPGSPTRGTVVTERLAVGTQMLVPAGVCNGFQAVSPDGCEYLYCFGVEWTPGMAAVAVNPLDPALAIDWPIPPDPGDPAMVSAKDAAAPLFAELA